MSKWNRERGEGESHIVFIILGVSIAISVGYFVLNFISDIKASRENKARKLEQKPPPKSSEEIGSYEVTY